VGADFGIAQEKAAIHQGPSKVFEAEVGQNRSNNPMRQQRLTGRFWVTERPAQ